MDDFWDDPASGVFRGCAHFEMLAQSSFLIELSMKCDNGIVLDIFNILKSSQKARTALNVYSSHKCNIDCCARQKLQGQAELTGNAHSIEQHPVAKTKIPKNANHGMTAVYLRSSLSHHIMMSFRP